MSNRLNHAGCLRRRCCHERGWCGLGVVSFWPSLRCAQRVKAGKTAAARRWVALPDDFMADIAVSVAREDRTPERRVFSGFTPDVAKNIMARACKTAGIVHRHPTT